MDLLKDDLGKLYRKFLIASFGSALIASIYGLVDMIVVGQYYGPDGAAAMSVIAGGVFNIFGDYFCVFTLDMGIRGAGIATAMGAGISTLVMLTHFFKKSNTLRLQFSKEIFRLFGRITVNGFSSFIIDVAMGVLTMLFNRQTMKYLGTDASRSTES